MSEVIEKSEKIQSEDKIVLRVEELTKKFNEVVAVNQVNFDVYEGEVLGIIGSNGSGKTTLFNMISGVLNPTHGKIYTTQLESFKIHEFIDIIKKLFRKKTKLGNKKGVNISGYKSHKILNKFGIVRTFQIVKPFKYMTSLENVTVPVIPRQFISSPTRLKGEGMRALLSVDLGEKQKYPAIVLPHGDLKRLDFARAMATNPKILLLDEPFSGLSSQDAFRVTQLIKNANKEFGVT
ncbi:MAG: ABC transporter ATP-binding protein, partial [Candidatus Heimdallarchaeota archaeon]|nr:ABC transporter ATP-binding protein [Candidatus Heimdallarchaeota archaeon]